MKIDKSMLEKLLELPDDKLTSMLSMISGGDLPTGNMDPKSMAGLREMLHHVTDSDIERATQLISQYKKGKRNGGRNGH